MLIQCVFNKFLYSETRDLNLNVGISEEYRSVIECLTPYLNDDSQKLHSAIDESRKILLRSWEALRVTGLKTDSIQRDTVGQDMDKFASRLKNIVEKWK